MKQSIKNKGKSPHRLGARSALDQAVVMNEAVVLGSLRQHELTAAAKHLNFELQGQILKRRITEDRLRVSEIRYRRLFEAAHNGMLLLDPRTRRITDANPFMTKLLGVSREHLIGKELCEVGLIKHAAANRTLFRKLKDNREVRYEEQLPASEGGSPEAVEVVSNLYLENGRPVIQCHIRNITRRRQAEDAVRRNEALFAALVKQVPVGVYVVDAGFHLVRVNPRARPLFKGIHPLLNRNFIEIIHHLWPPLVANQALAHFRHTLRTGKPYHSPEFSERRRDTGAHEVYEWQLQRIDLPTGQYGVVCFFNDITARKRTELVQQRLAVLTAANRDANREIARRRIVEIALRGSEETQSALLVEAHDLHAQLRRLTRQLLTTQEDERKHISRELHDDVLQTLVGITVELSALTKHSTLDPLALRKKILHTQRMVRGSIKAVHQFARNLRPAVLDDFGLIAALENHLETIGRRKSLHIHLQADHDVEVLDNAGQTVLFRVAQEALANVVRHAKAREARIHICRGNGFVRLEVRDDGKSFQVQKILSRKTNQRLGLVGMRERVEMIGGTLVITSVRGKGTTIRADIPLPPTLPAP